MGKPQTTFAPSAETAKAVAKAYSIMMSASGTSFTPPTEPTLNPAPRHNNI